MRRSGYSACSPVLGLQDLCQAVGRPLTQPDFNDRSDHCPNHMFEKPIGIGLNTDFLALAQNGKSL